MSEMHLTRELLWAIARGERSPGDLVPVSMSHLFELCSQCRRVFEAFRREVEGEGDLETGYDLAFERVRDRVAGLAPSETWEAADAAAAGAGQGYRERVEAEERRAVRLAAELLELPPEERIERVRRGPARYSGPALAHLLIEESRSRLPDRPREAHALADLARRVLQHGDFAPLQVELYARAIAHAANALRVRGRLCRGDELFAHARFLLKSQGGGDRLTRAELDSLEGSLRRARRELEEAEGLLSRAVMTYALEGREIDVARNLLNLGTVHKEQGDLERAIEITRQAEEALSPDEEPILYRAARHNRAHFLHEAGELDAATAVLEETLPLYERFPDALTQLRLLWLQGNLARDRGEAEAAESHLRAVRDGFLRQGIGYNAALASLDLAVLYLRQRRTGDLKRLAEEIVPVFEAEDVHREAVAALMLFQDAVRTERLTLRFVGELAGYLETARQDPRRAFRTPS